MPEVVRERMTDCLNTRVFLERAEDFADVDWFMKPEYDVELVRIKAWA